MNCLCAENRDVERNFAYMDHNKNVKNDLRMKKERLKKSQMPNWTKT
jgi:hypothetical protein